MSVKNPFISELKGLSSRLLEIGKDIEEGCLVEEACECLERILLFGIHGSVLVSQPTGRLLSVLAGSLTSQSNTTYDSACIASGHAILWRWLKQIAFRQQGASYAYIYAIESADKCGKVRSARGRTRLLIRTALVKKCIHIPVQLIGENGLAGFYYKKDSIIGDEVLREVLLSVLLVWSSGQLHFKLELNNARFLDDTWTLPCFKRFLTPPTPQLGISVLFVSGIAIVVDVGDYSVAAEHTDIQVGDVLDELNLCCINSSHHGGLGNILRKAGGQPISLGIVKADWKSGVFPALVPLLKEARIDIHAQILSRHSVTTDVQQPILGEGVVRYVGSVNVCGSGSGMKEIEFALNQLINKSARSDDCLELKEEDHLIPVLFEFNNLGVRVLRRQPPHNDVLLKHYYMQISSCATPSYAPEYFAYIASEDDGWCRSLSEGHRDKTQSNINCHVFQSSDTNQIDSLLRIMGQGFKRTHFTV